jgi:hypothetical protein
MGRRATTSLAAVALIVLSAPGAANGHSRSGIKGVLLNMTCPGPCVPPCPPCTAGVCPERSTAKASTMPCPASNACAYPCVPAEQPQPYTGPDAHVVVRRISDHRVVARRAPTDGRFRVRLRPGTYRVHGYVAESCWKGETERAVVHRGSFTALSLAVDNTCVVKPQTAAGG